MNIRDTPWDQLEKLELLAEIIKASPSPIPVEALIQIIITHGIQPQWNDIPLPRGRTLNQCLAMYSSMVPTHQIMPGFFPRLSGVRQPPPPSLDMNVSRRPYGMEGPASAPSTTGPRYYQELKPKPTETGAIPYATFSRAPPKKKRGRPSKADARLKEAARDIGEPNPPSHQERLQTPVAGTKSTGTSESSSGKRKRGRPSKAASEARATEDPVRPLVFDTPSRYPDILSRDPDAGSPSFRAPRGASS